LIQGAVNGFGRIVAVRVGIPFVVVRMISDKADGSSVVEYPVFETKAAVLCARVCSRMVELMAEEEL